MFNAAYSSFTTCLALDRQLPDAFHSRAVVAMALGQYRDALEDLQATIGLDPESKNAIVDRAICKLELNDLTGADVDITRAMDAGYPETRLYFLRARIRERLGKVQEAKWDRSQGLEREPYSEADWSARALARLPEQPKGALADLDRCLQSFPKSSLAWQNRAYIFDEFMRDPDQAIHALNEAMRLEPDNGALWAGRGVLKARRAEFAAARADASKALDAIGVRSYANKLDERPEVLYQVAGIFALTAKDRPTDLDKCLFLLNRALQLGYGMDLVEIDPELKSVRDLAEVKRMVAVAKRWKNVGGFGGSGE
jgi:Tfp pilus assembly protein PilF